VTDGVARPEVLARVLARIVGRQPETEITLAALDAGRHVVLEGPPGTGKSTLVRTLAEATGLPFLLVEGHAELTPARLIGHHDPSRVLSEGYTPGTFVEGPLVRAASEGAILYVEELNRVPEETLNVLITVMSEGELHVPRVGTFVAAPGFAVVAAMNPFDAVGTARISSAISDRTCRLSMGYQSADDEREIVLRRSGVPDSPWLAAVVEVVRRTRTHPDVRVGASVRGAIDLVLLAGSLARLRAVEPHSGEVTFDAARAALSGRVRLHESYGRSPEDVIAALCAEVFGGAGDAVAAPERTEDHQGKGDPVPGPAELARGRVVAGPEVRQMLAEERRHTFTREQLSRRPLFREVSPEPGVFRESPLDSPAEPQEALELLVDVARAAEPDLRELARRLAGRVLVRFAQSSALTSATSPGAGRLHRTAWKPGMDIDLDGSLDSLVEARAARTPPTEDALHGEAWARRSTAVCLLVDRSGSMGGGRVLAAALAAAAVAQRTDDDYSVIAFADDAVVVKGQTEARSAEAVVDDLLALVGYGMTDVALALRTAGVELARSPASRRVAILLSDCRSTNGDDPLAAAAGLDEVHVLAPPGGVAEGERVARAGHGRCVELPGPLEVPAALAALMT
jgi:magnesium chelatase subunit D